MAKGLKALKTLIDTMPFVFLESRTKQNCIKDIECELKALKVIVKTLNIRVSINKLGQCFLEDNHCIYAISQSTYDLLKEVLK